MKTLGIVSVALLALASATDARSPRTANGYRSWQAPTATVRDADPARLEALALLERSLAALRAGDQGQTLALAAAATEVAPGWDLTWWRYAETAELVGRPALAIEAWTELVRRTGSPLSDEALLRATEVARVQLMDESRALAVLELLPMVSARRHGAAGKQAALRWVRHELLWAEGRRVEAVAALDAPEQLLRQSRLRSWAERAQVRAWTEHGQLIPSRSSPMIVLDADEPIVASKDWRWPMSFEPRLDEQGVPYPRHLLAHCDWGWGFVGAPEGFLITGFQLEVAARDESGFEAMNLGSTKAIWHCPEVPRVRLAVDPPAGLIKIRVPSVGPDCSDWTLRAELQPLDERGCLTVRARHDGKASWGLVAIDPPLETACHAGQKTYRPPFTVRDLSAGTHRVLVYESTASDRPCDCSLIEPGQEYEVSVPAGGSATLTLDLGPSRRQRELAWLLPGWGRSVTISQGLRARRLDGLPSEELSFDSARGFVLSFDVVGDEGGARADLFTARSRDGSAWSEPQRYPAPVNTTAEEDSAAGIRLQDGRELLAFLSDRLGRLAVWVSSSSDGEQWSVPQPLWETRHWYAPMAWLSDGEGRPTLVGFDTAGGLMRADLTSAGRVSEVAKVAAPAMQVLRVGQDSSGSWWMLGTPSDAQTSVLYAKSADGRAWTEPVRLAVDTEGKAISRAALIGRGSLHLLALHVGSQLVFWSSRDLQAWSGPNVPELKRGSWGSWPESWTLAAGEGKSLVLVHRDHDSGRLAASLASVAAETLPRPPPRLDADRTGTD